MKLTKEVWKEHGLNLTLSVLDLGKSTWYYWKNEKVNWDERYETTRERIIEIIDDHPEYGRPRITPEIEDRFETTINHKVVEKLLRHWEIQLKSNARKTGKSPVEEVIEAAGEGVNLAKKRRQKDSPIRPFELLYTDFTIIEYANGMRKAKMMPIIGHTTKLILGWSLAKERGTAMAIRAWEDAVETLSTYGVNPDGVILHHDQDSVYKSDKWISTVFLESQAQISYTKRGAKDNTYMESFNGHFKNPVESRFSEAPNMRDLREVIEERVRYWNEDRRHSSLGQRSPLNYLREEEENENF